MRFSNQKGYIALISSFILSGIIITLTFILAGSSLLGRYNTLIANDKKTSRFLAESCLEVARLRLVQNSSYAGNETVTIGSNTCTIQPIQSATGQKIITAISSAGQSKTILKLIASDTNLLKISLEELAN